MKKIVLFGAGKSATTLISYLAAYSERNHCHFTVCDQNLEATKKKLQQSQASEAVSIDVTDEHARQQLVRTADIVISLLPPALHILVARDCVLFSKNLLTASYVDEAMAALASEISEKKILFIAEMGLDPGIDHMSAMQIIDRLTDENASIHAFHSHCGGLVAPESDDNPWHYKVTWNPANVVSAGSSGARYLENGKEIFVPYTAVFANANQKIAVDQLGSLTWYANRNSIPYIDTYGLQGVQTFIRTTLRYPEFITAWNVIVEIGLTAYDDGATIRSCKTVQDWFSLKTALATEANTEDYITTKLSSIKKQLEFLGFFSNDLLPTKESSAKILQSILEQKLVMHPDDRDMIVMVHEVDYESNKERKKLTSTLVVKGENSLQTAMSKTVGMPLAIATTLILEGKIKLTGLHIPVIRDIYEPVLSELKKQGISFGEKNWPDKDPANV